MSDWLNHAVFSKQRNGTNSHSVAIDSATDLAGGAQFTPTAGRLLVCICGSGSVMTTPSGWTQRNSTVDNTGLYIWTKVATGSDNFTATGSSSNRPAVFDIYELAADAAYVASNVDNGVASGAAGAGLSGLDGSAHWILSVANFIVFDTTARTTSWAAGTETADVDRIAAPPDNGIHYAAAELNSTTATSAGGTVTISTSTTATAETAILVMSPGSVGGYSPIDCSAVRTSGSTATVSWSPDDGANGATILRAAGAHATDGSGDAYGAPGYDPTTISGAAIIATGQDSPYLDTGLSAGVDYTYAVIRTGP